MFLTKFFVKAQNIQKPKNPISTQADEGFYPCPDTIKILFFKKRIDVGRIIPEWPPVIGFNHVSILEGTVIPKPNSKNLSTHVSGADFPLYHYTHDFGFNVKPDKAPDNRYTNLLPLRVFNDTNAHGDTVSDTVLREYVHIEWESGLAANNKGNPCSELNKKGKSCGFYSKGHNRGDVIWNWPTFGDWVHVEGLWIWDRGHPPAYTEIHPVRLIAIKRQLPELITLVSERKVYATRVDIFANGDGGALYNNRENVPEFVKKVKMSDKDYVFNIKQNLPRPSAHALLNVKIVTRNGDNYTGDFQTTILNHNANATSGEIQFSIAWLNVQDTALFARTVYIYWDEGNGKSDNYNISAYEISLESMRFKKRKEFLSRSEFRIFLEVGGNWLFLNEFSKGKNILDNGHGKTWIRKRKIEKSFVIYVPEDTNFRIHVGGWEADGVNREYGELMDQYSPCNCETKAEIQHTLRSVSPFALRGCYDDEFGAVNAIHTNESLMDENEFKAWSDGEKEEDICLLSNGIQERAFWLKYKITKLNTEP